MAEEKNQTIRTATWSVISFILLVLGYATIGLNELSLSDSVPLVIAAAILSCASIGCTVVSLISGRNVENIQFWKILAIVVIVLATFGLWIIYGIAHDPFFNTPLY
ncbi:hypothetical protein A3B18_04105 [Candidatus Giovannonibacteria bacterium RIFCSPLOWO2_01_FULL_46_13]|uniref:Uncharacterized protein n=1 Tax=Candidatus Giovannonibacteria bacterium RIFCSPLOWO2_01_FULL_46_13 TaxID=1798352 RepID=A0A1F5X2R5_9BACT|nr:MAG: hypothetical protein A3B18_04105 [Candidatus Giovannonibacteria bacterium RIFCSPLOWO2_01_FULL_46_13]